MTPKQAVSLTIGMVALGVVLIVDAAELPAATVPVMVSVMILSLVASYVWK